ncbi:hypothetical protein EYC84_007838 [Monilinia fructicola]|uniref:Uncharacterized protein n=1 Tax=Monilinia fructicola TaxID=38448 RepID=A0A5M9JLJ0_MONFR|nr:hypothetical protein EYC84_007838 [Monilinia fructicola]
MHAHRKNGNGKGKGMGVYHIYSAVIFALYFFVVYVLTIQTLDRMVHGGVLEGWIIWCILLSCIARNFFIFYFNHRRFSLSFLLIDSSSYKRISCRVVAPRCIQRMLATIRTFAFAFALEMEGASIKSLAVIRYNTIR